ncbi:MAG: SUMF1/EgtB/PvdO family nonheme iron enzyme [Thermoplasmata archaeon]
MRKLVVITSLLAILVGCNKRTGELVGVTGREQWYQPDPFGTLYIPMGSFHMGPDDEETPMAHTTKTRMVSVQAFYIDDSEISNNEYRQFVYWVRDSIARKLLAYGSNGMAEDYQISQDEFLQMWPIYKGDDNLPEYYINWETKIKWDSEDEAYRNDLQPLYLPQGERFYNRKEIDTRKLNYEYYRIDIRLAASKSNRFRPQKSADIQDAAHEYKKGEYINGVHLNDGNIDKLGTPSSPVGDPSKDPKVLGTYNVKDEEALGMGNYRQRLRNGVDRSVFIVKDVINVYPDTLAWVHDYTYSFNEPMTNMYFWHPAYDNYPVVGISWKQARAFSIWRSLLLNNYLIGTGQSIVNDFRLPTESEWEYAARGGLDKSPYPWGGPYIRNSKGCFLGNFKPIRGSYIDDGGFHTVYIYSYNPNDYGLYCMAGNVAEWTSNAFDESAYDFEHDLNPDYVYEAQEKEANVLKRKVIRGGSWKDIGFYLQVSSRTYEYQDTAKCYIGFRNVMTYLGRAKGDEF